MKDLTTGEVAKILNVQIRIARRWCEQGLFPNAYQLPVTVGRGKAWLIPENDVKNFKMPIKGRKPSDNPSKATLAKRAQREREKATSQK